MSYAIIRNEKYTKDQMIKLAPHNERVKKEYSNKNIDKSKSYKNYHLKKPEFANYFKEFKRLKEENNLKGQLHKNSIYACEMIITSDKEFFEKIGEKETKRYFQTAYNFICNYKNLGEENIISAVVHLDEETPHMHLTFIPVVDSKDKESNPIRKIGGNEFWKEKNSYKILQDKFYNYVKENGFKLDRGKNINNTPHFRMEELKDLTNFYESKDVGKDLTKENIRLNKELKELRLKVSRLENSIAYYTSLECENENLKIDIKAKQNEIKVLYDLIVRLNNEKDELIKKAKEIGIDLEETINA